MPAGGRRAARAQGGRSGGRRRGCAGRGLDGRSGRDVGFEVRGRRGAGQAINLLGVRGRLVVVAIHATPPPVNLFRVFWRELDLIGARVYERADFEHAVGLLAKAPFRQRALITRIEPLSRVAAAFETLEAGEAMKILIACGEES